MKDHTILLVDDDIDDLEMFTIALAEVDPEVSIKWAKDGFEALETLSKFPTPPTFIFLDLNMPKMNGKKCLSEIRKISAFAKVPVVIYSTSRIKDDIKEMKKLGASSFLVKPVQFSALKQSLKRILSTDWSAEPCDFFLEALC